MPPEIIKAQQRWPALARQAAARGHDPHRAFALARAVMLGWWQQAATWQDEQIWPQRLHRLTHRPAPCGSEGERSASLRDAAVLPEVLTLT